MTQQIPLTQGLFALVDDEDYERVGEFKWHARGDIDGRFYAVRNTPMVRGIRGKTTYLHRAILSAPAELVVDHANGDTLDNRKANIRLCERRQNQRNITSSKNQKRGGFKGVHWEQRRGYWYADIKAGAQRANGKRASIYLGKFPSAELAARRYDIAAIEFFGEFANTNFPRSQYDDVELIKMVMASRDTRRGGLVILERAAGVKARKP